MIHSYFCLSESIFSWFRVSKFFFRYLWSIDNAMMHQHCVNMEAVKTIVSCLGLYSYCLVSQRLKEAMIIPIGSMYGIFTYTWLILILMVNKCRQIYYTWILWDIEFLWTRMIPDVFCLVAHVTCLCVCVCWNIDMFACVPVEILTMNEQFDELASWNHKKFWSLLRTKALTGEYT